jgi:hypothetical protein
MKHAQAGRDMTLVRQSGLVVVALHLAYAAVTLAGFLSLPRADVAIGDPWFAAMEWLIILIGPPVLVFLCALGGIEGAGKAWSLAAVVLAALTFALSASLHAVLLALGREDVLVAEGGALAFTWPSAAYAIDILAWDWFFALALLCCARSLRHAQGMTVSSRAFLVAGLLSLAGLAGPTTGIIMARNIGIIGYAVCFPIAVVLVLRALERGRAA